MTLRFEKVLHDCISEACRLLDPVMSQSRIANLLDISQSSISKHLANSKDTTLDNTTRKKLVRLIKYHRSPLSLRMNIIRLAMEYYSLSHKKLTTILG